ncbi:hypothetical protein V6N12_055482 [Hibiscus sabdariffa]|uniref:Uncharacterized protein n=1 Tax=Hibiscus sabdariffa TaxID=183260 RepID=A0ABR2BTX8_9ROSI
MIFLHIPVIRVQESSKVESPLSSPRVHSPIEPSLTIEPVVKFEPSLVNSSVTTESSPVVEPAIQESPPVVDTSNPSCASIVPLPLLWLCILLVAPLSLQGPTFGAWSLSCGNYRQKGVVAFPGLNWRSLFFVAYLVMCSTTGLGRTSFVVPVALADSVMVKKME